MRAFELVCLQESVEDVFDELTTNEVEIGKELFQPRISYVEKTNDTPLTCMHYVVDASCYLSASFSFIKSA